MVMQGVFVASHLILLTVALTLAAAGSVEPSKAYKLKDVQTMRFNAERPVEFVPAGMPPLRQMICVGGTANCSLGLQPSWATCHYDGFDGVDVRWNCESDVDPEEAVIADTLVQCANTKEGNVVPGSCTLKYVLDEVRPAEPVDLRKVSKLVFKDGLWTKGRRTPRVAQAVSIKALPSTIAPQFMPEEITCINAGNDGASGPVHWRCSSVLSYHVFLAKTTVICEEFRHADPALDHPAIVLKDSCNVNYQLEKSTPDEDAYLVEVQREIIFEGRKHFTTDHNPEPRSPLKCEENCTIDVRTVECKHTVQRVGAPVTRSTAVKAWAPGPWRCSSPQVRLPLMIKPRTIACEGAVAIVDEYVAPKTCVLHFSIGEATDEEVEPVVRAVSQPSPPEVVLRYHMDALTLGSGLWFLYYGMWSLNTVWFFVFLFVFIRLVPYAAPVDPNKKDD